VPFRLTYQISIQIELVTNVSDRSGDKCHLGHGSMSPKSAPPDGGPSSESNQPKPSRRRQSSGNHAKQAPKRHAGDHAGSWHRLGKFLKTVHSMQLQPRYQ